MTLNKIFALLTVTLPLAAQAPAGDKKANQTGQGWFPEVEFVASHVFRSGSYVQPLWKGLHFEGHYFGNTFISGKVMSGKAAGVWPSNLRITSR